MSFTDTIFEILEEQLVLKTTRTKPIVDAIKNRKKITFYYSGPRKPKKNSVKAGYRVKAEVVALGLSKRGNLVMRAYVEAPSVSKKGFSEHGWRTFMLSRMSRTEITDEVFNEKRPGYKEGDDNGLSVTYVTTDWTNKPEVKKSKIVKPTKTPTEPVVTPTEPEITPTEPEVTPTEPKTTELPQPKPKTKPEKVVSKPEPTKPEPTEPTTPEEPKQTELPQPKPKQKPVANPEEDEENKNLKESIKNIKRLMFS
jgi:hypothetical protein